MAYTNIFGGSAIQPSDVMYIRLTLTGNTQLSWPTQYVDNPITPYVVARTTEVTTNGANYVLTMPPANQVSPGMSSIFRNVGANTFSVNDNSGNLIIQILGGQAWNIYPTDTTTTQGVWGIFQQGTGTSSADATSLAGNGLIPLVGKLNSDLPTHVLNANYVSSAADLATLFINNTGSITFTLPTAVSIFDGFYLAINNTYGQGNISIGTSDNIPIDGLATFTMGQEQSAYFAYNLSLSKWVSLGYGLVNSFGYGYLALSVAGNSNITLSDAQAKSQIQYFYGTLTGNISIIYPAIPGEWIIENATTGAFNLNIITSAGGSIPFLIPQGNTFLVYSNGQNFGSPTIPSTSISFPSGSAPNPSITFEADQTTGLYLVNPGVLGLTTSGTQAMSFSDGTVTVTPNFAAQANTTIAGTLGVTGLATFTSNVDVVSDLAVGGDVTFTNPLLVVDGGTGLATIAAGQVIGASALNTFSAITPGVAGTVLTSTGPTTIPAFAPGGKILQVQSTIFNTSKTGTNSTPQLIDASFTLSITPTFNTSKILILLNLNVSAGGDPSTSSGQGSVLVRIGRNGVTTIALGQGAGIVDAAQTTMQSIFGAFNPGGGSYISCQNNMAMTFLDSPATTSPVVYAPYIQGNGSLGWAVNNNYNFPANLTIPNGIAIGISTITVMEIGV